ncbi:hypothetical protein ACJJIU_06440 [Microbulbifer sp. CnH-101-E]|uniref:hypothetical protein n=1 Tax=unclassified Microbulbifer TaxID=2619833 RepID=UPI00403931AB
MRWIIICLFNLIWSLSCAASTCDIEKVRKYFEVTVYLSEPIPVDTIELKESVENEKGVFLPFGNLNSEWLALKNKYKEGDCFVYFKTPQLSWKALHGREGYLLVRQGEPISALIIKMN